MQTGQVNSPGEEIAVPFLVVLSAACAAEMEQRARQRRYQAADQPER